MKQTRFAVVEINNKTGWILFCSSYSKEGSCWFHNPLQMATFTEEKADSIVEERKNHIGVTTPYIKDEIYITKIAIN